MRLRANQTLSPGSDLSPALLAPWRLLAGPEASDMEPMLQILVILCLLPLSPLLPCSCQLPGPTSPETLLRTRLCYSWPSTPFSELRTSPPLLCVWIVMVTPWLSKASPPQDLIKGCGGGGGDGAGTQQDKNSCSWPRAPTVPSPLQDVRETRGT